MKYIWLMTAIAAAAWAVALPEPAQPECPPIPIDSIKAYLASNPDAGNEPRDLEKRACFCAGSAGGDGWRLCPCGPRIVSRCVALSGLLLTLYRSEAVCGTQHFTSRIIRGG